MIGAVLWSLVVSVALLANVACVLGGILGAVMIAQFLEHGVISAVYRHKLQKNRSLGELRILFYRSYWSLTLLYLLASALWVYLSERTTSKLLYGVVFLFVMQLAQLALAVTLSSWEDVLAKAKEFGRQPWVRSIKSRILQRSARA